MPSAYILAKDRIEQARAILANEVWFDAQADHLFDVMLARLDELETRLAKAPSGFDAVPDRTARVRLMPWLAP